MSENDPRVVEIEVLSLTEVLINGRRIKSNNHIFQLSYDDLIDNSILGFNRLHKKIEMILGSVPGLKNVKIEDLISLIANSSLTRISHIEQSIGVPRYVAKKIFSELVQGNACVMSGGTLKKTQEYYSIIKDYDIRHRERSRKDNFIIPPEFDEVPGSITPPLCKWEIKNLYKLREDAIAVGVEKARLEPINRQIELKKEEEKEKRDERIEEIMKTRKIGKHEAEDIWEDEFINETHSKTEGQEEWYSDQQESENQDKTQTKKQKKGVKRKTNKREQTTKTRGK